MARTSPATATTRPARPLRIAVVGAGFGGLCMGIQLELARRAGPGGGRPAIADHTIFDAAAEIGGTWRDNTYPGAGCDVPSHLYSYSFEKYSSWTRRFPGQPEILDYLRHCVSAYGLEPRLRLSTAITGASYDAATGGWRLRTGTGIEHHADVVVFALGQLNRPYLPDIPGRDGFTGTWFHSARWDHGHDLTGRRVAVIGNGASAVQFIPRIAPVVDRLHVFQRTPNWVIPKPDAEFGGVVRELFHRVPALQRAYRGRIYLQAESLLFPALRQGWSARLVRMRALELLNRQVADPELRAALTPDYPVGCKRILFAGDYYPALTRDNVELVTDPIAAITPEGVRTAGGAHRPVDTIVYATGFRATEFLSTVDVRGRDGTDLREVWRDGAHAYLGMALPEFPNLFLLYGPNTNLGHNSIVFMIECQVRYIMRCLAVISARGAAGLEVRQAAMRRFQQETEAALARTVWQAGCDSWYKTAAGRVTNNWPHPSLRYWRMTRRPEPADFRLLPAGPA